MSIKGPTERVHLFREMAAEKRGRYPLDQLLRSHGFAIHSRPGGKAPTLWKRNGELYNEFSALALATRLERDMQEREAGVA